MICERIEVRMPLSLDQTLGAGNYMSYEVRKLSDSGSYLPLTRVSVDQKFGPKNYSLEDCYLLGTIPNSVGVFVINQFDYGCGRKSRNVSLRFTAEGAKRAAHKHALRIARNYGNEGLLEVIDKSEEDIANLKADIKSLKE